MAQVEFFFDCSSPWSYLAFTPMQELLARTPAALVWRPISVGGVFNTINREVCARRANPDPRKASYYEKDLQDWARLAGIRIGKPPVFPVRAVLAMRCVLAADERGALVPFARAVFAAYWGDLSDIAQPEALAGAAASVGLDGAGLLTRAASPAIKEALRQNTDEPIARGGFGAPTLFVDGDDMYFGNDRLPLVEAALARSS